MTHDDAFLQAILDAPDDDTPRLVLADWLEEQGQPERAEFIRAQCELAKTAVYNDRRRELQTRQQALLAAHGVKWLGQEWPQASGRPVNARTFDRGLVADLSLRGVSLGDAGARELARCPRLGLLTGLDLRGADIRGEGVRALADSPFLARLAFLDLRDNPLWYPDLEPLAASPRLPALRELALNLERGYTVSAPDFSGEVIESGRELDEEGMEWVQAAFRRRGKDVAVHR